MDWDNLKIFLSVARNGTTRRASEELDVSASTINRRLFSFEEQLGARLFDRYSTGYKLTSAGRKQARHVPRLRRTLG